MMKAIAVAEEKQPIIFLPSYTFKCAGDKVNVGNHIPIAKAADLLHPLCVRLNVHSAISPFPTLDSIQ